MDDYKLLGKIGKGAHGLVFRALNLKDNNIVALKQITVINTSSGLPKNIMREILVLRNLQSPNIVQLVDVSNLDSAILVVMEYLPYNLGELLQRVEEPFPLPQVKMYMKMILLGVKTMHNNNIMHRDLKPANLLISREGVLKIADFGLSRIFKNDKNSTYTHQVGTRWYRAPELLYGAQKYTQAVDLWAVGCILAEMIDKQPLFPGESDIGQLAVVLATLGTPSEETWPDLKSLPDYSKISFTPSVGLSWDKKFPEADSFTIDLISNFLRYNHLDRIDAFKALNHRFFFQHPLPWTLPKDFGRIKLESETIWHLKDFDEIIKLN